MLRGVYGSEREKVTGEWRALRREELHNNLESQVQENEVGRMCR